MMCGNLTPPKAVTDRGVERTHPLQYDEERQFKEQTACYEPVYNFNDPLPNTSIVHETIHKTSPFFCTSHHTHIKERNSHC